MRGLRRVGETAQYREHQMEEARPEDGAPDLGAFELPEPGIDTGLALGFLALGMLARRRGRRRARRRVAARARVRV